MQFNLRGLLQDEQFLIGAGLLQAGSQGQNIGQAIFPTMLQAGKTQNLFASADAAQKKREAFSKLLESDHVSDIDRLYLAAGIAPPKKKEPKSLKFDTMYKGKEKFDIDLNDPNNKTEIQRKINDGWSFDKPDAKGKNFKTLYHKDGRRAEVDLNNPEDNLKLDYYINNDYSFSKFDKPKKLTISDEALRIYNDLKNAPNFEAAFEKLNQAEKDIYIKQIKGNHDAIAEFLKESKKEQENQNKIDFKNYNLTPDALKQYGENVTVEEIFNAFKKENSSLTDQELINALIENNFIIGG